MIAFCFFFKAKGSAQYIRNPTHCLRNSRKSNEMLLFCSLKLANVEMDLNGKQEEANEAKK